VFTRERNEVVAKMSKNGRKVSLIDLLNGTSSPPSTSPTTIGSKTGRIESTVPVAAPHNKSPEAAMPTVQQVCKQGEKQEVKETKDERAVREATNLDLLFLLPALREKCPRGFNLLRLLEEYKRFLAIKTISGDTEEPLSLSPSALVDLVWHEHILHSRQYRLACTKLGVILDHDPCGARDSANAIEKRLNMTKAFYRLIFKEDAPDKYWKRIENFDDDLLENETEYPAKRRKKSKTVNLVVKTLTGNNLNIRCSKDDEVETLKARIQDVEGIPADQQRVIVAGHQMTDGRKLNDYGVEDGTTVHLILRLGGC